MYIAYSSEPMLGGGGAGFCEIYKVTLLSNHVANATLCLRAKIFDLGIKNHSNLNGHSCIVIIQNFWVFIHFVLDQNFHFRVSIKFDCHSYF